MPLTAAETTRARAKIAALGPGTAAFMLAKLVRDGTVIGQVTVLRLDAAHTTGSKGQRAFAGIVRGLSGISTRSTSRTIGGTRYTEVSGLGGTQLNLVAWLHGPDVTTVVAVPSMREVERVATALRASQQAA